MNQFMDIQTTDVLIVGAGGAGMRAAIAAAESGVDVTVVTKGQVARSGATPMACPSYQAAFALEDPRDNPELAFEDTCFEGRYLGDENLIYALTNEATERAYDLLSFGVKFRVKENGKFLQVVHPGHSYERNLVIQGSGYAMAAGLRRQMAKFGNIHVVEDFVITRIISDGISVQGIVGLDMRKGKPVAFGAPAVILATGGYPELWRWTDTEPGLTGEGVYLAYQAGADLVDLEMMLFYPAGLCYPTEVEGTLVQYEGLLTDKYCAGKMLNGKGEAFLPETERLPVRDVMMKLMFREIEEGRGTPHGGVYIDLRKSPKTGEDIKRILTTLDSLPYNQLNDLGIDVLNQPIEVKPVTHYTLGGVHINEFGETTLPGLFAAGEVTGNIHGANRTSGNALAETQVFGYRAGKRAAEYATNISQRILDADEVSKEFTRIESFTQRRKFAIRPIDIKRKIKAIMHENVNHKRNAEGLNEAIHMLQEMRSNDVPRICSISGPKVYNYEWEEALEAVAMVDLAEIVVASALLREESRGHHWRTDFPAMRKDWEQHTAICKSNGGTYSMFTKPVVRLKNRSIDRREADPALIAAGVLEGYEGV